MKKEILAIAGLALLTAGLALGYDWYIHERWYAKEPAKDFALSRLIADIRSVTEPYQDVHRARADGYTQVSGNVPLRGYHFTNGAITRFDYTHPSTLLYVRGDGRWQLVGVEYTVAQPSSESPFPGVAWERKLAMCRYADWQEFLSVSANGCPPTHPDTKSAFAVWYPEHRAIRLWLWYPNPYGLFARLNPLLAPFDDRTIPPDEAGSWAEWQAHTAFSNFNHNVSGWLVSLMGVAMLLPVVWGEQRRARPGLVWALLALTLAVLVLYRSDPTAWPYGVMTLRETLADRETVEHKLSGLIILVLGIVEWLRARGTLFHWAWGLLFPWLAITGGTILLFHLHPVSNFNYLGRNNVPHVTEGITAILAGVTYLLGLWGIMPQRWWRLVPAALVILMGVQLIVYLE
jgi:hypothetical protein